MQLTDVCLQAHLAAHAPADGRYLNPTQLQRAALHRTSCAMQQQRTLERLSLPWCTKRLAPSGAAVRSASLWRACGIDARTRRPWQAPRSATVHVVVKTLGIQAGKESACFAGTAGVDR